MFKFIGLSVFIFGFIIAYSTLDDLTPYWFHQTNKKIENLWQQDMELLIKSGKLPSQWRSISEVQVEALNDESRQILKEIRVPIVTKPEGDFKLEVTVDSWTDSSKTALVIQYHLLDKKTNNLVWELGRTIETDVEAK